PLQPCHRRHRSRAPVAGLGRARQGAAAQLADRLPELCVRARRRQARSGPVDLALRSSRVVVALLVILGWAAAAHAEDAAQPSPAPAEDSVQPSRAPAGVRNLADIPFQLVLPQGHLLGDWAGARPWLEERGITPAVTFVMDALGNPTGGMQQGFRQASNLGVDLRFP